MRLAHVGSREQTDPKSATDALTSELLSPTQVRHFGDFILLHEIARGGMGVVFRAHQISLNREVAVKMILAGQLATPDLVERFRREAQAAARLDHPQIVPIYEVGEYETQHYFAMKLVEGGSLGDAMSRFCLRSLGTERTKQTRQREREIVSVLLKVSQALAYAHAHGILHRDVKPNNILLEHGNEPLLTDFGLAKGPAQSSDLTGSGAFLGSPSYMAPEQTRGGKRALTPAVDVYGVGAVLYEMLTGRPPFVGENALATLRQLQDEEPLPVLRLMPGAHPDLATLCHRCLEKEPEARYGSMSAVADELQSFLQGRPIRARPVSNAERLVRWCRRRPTVAALSCVVLLMAWVGLAAVFWQWQRAESANGGLIRSLRHVERQRTEQLVEAHEASRAVAILAARLRANPKDTGAAMLAISVLEQHHFGIPVSSLVSHGPGVSLNQVQLHSNGQDVVTAGSDGRAWLWAIKPVGKGTQDSKDVSPFFEFLTNRPPLEHTGPVRWVALSRHPERDWVATASDDSTARVWRVADGKPVSPPLRHDGPVRMVVFEPEARRVATASADGTVRLWDPQTGELVAPPLPQNSPVSSVAFSRDGRWLAAGFSGGAALWELQSLEHGPRFLLPVQGTVNAVQFDPKNQRLLTVAHLGSRVEVWSLQDGHRLFECRAGSKPWSGEFSADGSRIGVASSGRWGRLWDATSGQPVGPELMHYYTVLGSRFTPEGRRLATFSWDSTVRFWDSATGQQAGEPLLHADPVLDAEFSMSGDALVTLSGPWDTTRRVGTTQMRLWSLSNRGAQPLRFSPGSSMTTASFSPDGSRLAVADMEGLMWILDAANMKPQWGPLTNGTAYLRGLAWTPDGQRLVASSMDGTLRVWDANTGICRVGPVRALTKILTTWLGANGAQLMLGGDEGKVALFDPESGRVRPLLSKHQGELNGVDVSRNGKWAASGAEDGTLGVYDIASGSRRLFFRGHDDEVISVHFSPDSQRLLSASHDETARIWDVRSGAPIGRPMRHQAQVVVAMWSPDGRRIVTAARDGTARIWDAPTGAPLCEPMRHRSALRGASFSPDGQRVVTEDHFGLRIWDAETGDALTVTLPHSSMPGIGYNAQGLQVSFSPNGQRIVHGTGSEDVVIYEVPVPPGPAPTWFPELLESIIGTTLSRDGMVEELNPAGLSKVWNEFTATGEGDFYARWARWYLKVDSDRPRHSAWVDSQR